jgi:peptide/nickel transport system substrate-binding protein
MTISKKPYSMNRRQVLKSAAALGAFSALGAFGALGSSAVFAQTGEPKRGGILRVGIGGAATTDPLDPALIANPATRLFTRQWGDSLIELDKNGIAVGRLAASFSPNADASVWTFVLREGVKFHDGSPLTGEDVAETFRRHLDKNTRSVVAPMMADFAEIKADGLNVVITLKAPNTDMPYMLTDYHLPIQPKGGRGNPNAMIGTGPYKVDVAEPGVRYVLSRNTADWNQNRGFYDGVQIYVMNDMTARTAALSAGQVHMINLVGPKIAARLDTAKNVELRRTPSRGHYAFAAMVDKPPFDNKDLRLALKYAMNREEIRDKILFGYGTIGNDVPINEAYPLYRNVLEQRRFDLAKAAEHYRASGHDGSPIVLNISQAVFPGAVDAGMLWQENCRKAGIPLQVKQVPDDGYWENVWGVQPFTTDNFNGRPVQDLQYSVFYGKGAPWNKTHFNNDEFNQLLVTARTETDLEARAGMYARMSQILWEEGGAFIPVFTDFLDASATNITGWQVISADELMGGYAPSLTWFA